MPRHVQKMAISRVKYCRLIFRDAPILGFEYYLKLSQNSSACVSWLMNGKEQPGAE